MRLDGVKREGRGGPALRAALLIGAALAAPLGCGAEDEATPKADAGAGDGGSADASGDGGGDVTGDASDAGDGAAACGALPSCLNDNGVEDLSRCPAPQSDYACQAGCCVVKQVCKSDADCAAALGGPLCPDQRFTCGCDVSSGACVQTVCQADGDCAAGQLCDGGGCKAPPAASSLQAVLWRTRWLARPGQSGAAAALLGAQARVVGGPDDGAVDPNAALTWTLQGDGFTLADGVLTAGASAGKATITAQVAGGKASAPATLWNLGPLGAGVALRVTAVDEETLAPLTGKAYAVCDPAAATPTVVEADLGGGQAEFKGLSGPCDVHVVAPDHDLVSALRVDLAAPAELLLASRLRHFAALAFDGAGEPVAADWKLHRGGVVQGAIDYEGQGEAGLGITSFAIGSDLLLFNLDAIIGPNVQRPFHPEAPALVNPEPDKPQDIPGGVTFYLGKKVVESYVLAAPPGQRVLWSLAGRLPLSDLLSQVGAIVAAVDGGLDIGKVVGVLLPYLQGFYSQVVTGVTLADQSGVQTPQQRDLNPSVPLGVGALVEAPALPVAGDGVWSDLVLAIAGALLPDGNVVPLGIAAGSDTAGDGVPADGVVDGDQEEAGDQPLTLNSAPLHSGLRVGADNRVLVTAAITVGGKGKREGGSITFSAPGPLAKTLKPEPFLPFALASTWQAETRALTVAAVPGATFYRVVLTGSEGRRWTLLLPPDQAGATLTLPDAKAWGADAALVDKPKRVFVGAFVLRDAAAGWSGALADGTFADLVRRTARCSFVDVH
jgi:hypothetical protein